MQSEQGINSQLKASNTTPSSTDQDIPREQTNLAANPSNSNASVDPLTLLYDGQCPICQFYVKRLQANDLEEDQPQHHAHSLTKKLRFIDARTAPAECQSLFQQGFDINQGVVLQGLDSSNGEEKTPYGDAALTYLANRNGHSNLFRRINVALFKNAKRSRRLYPILVGLRNILLKLLRVKPIETDQSKSN